MLLVRYCIHSVVVLQDVSAFVLCIHAFHMLYLVCAPTLNRLRLQSYVKADSCSYPITIASGPLQTPIRSQKRVLSRTYQATD